MTSTEQISEIDVKSNETKASSDDEELSNKKKLGTEIGKAAAEKSRGLFSAEDWQCSKCANVNWARRQTCNMCNAPKFSDVEERTGYGGGYNDRGVVEYKDRQDSDGEFDEFGRRKKTRGSSQKSDSSSSRHKYDQHKKKISDKKSEVDDSDDEGDLSKYALFDSDDELPYNSKRNQSSSSSSSSSSDENKSRSKSTSRSKTRSRSRSNTINKSSSHRESSSISSNERRRVGRYRRRLNYRSSYNRRYSRSPRPYKRRRSDSKSRSRSRETSSKGKYKNSRK